MKQLEKKDLIISEIYKASDTCLTFIIKATKNLKNVINIPSYNAFMRSGNFNAPYLTFTNATPEEKHWLEACITANGFISYEEAMKTFIPEYVECIKVDSKMILNNIYKVKSSENWSVASIDGCDIVVYIEPCDIDGPYYLSYFKPSTKEAYDAQFVVKEPDFVLPELWCIKLTNENRETVINYINKNTNDGERSGNIGMYYGYNGEYCTHIGNVRTNTVITTEQFKQYVLKENTTVTEKPKIVLEEPKDKVLSSMKKNFESIIHTVESSEGAIYQLGDKITVFTKNSPNKGKVFTIKGFRWNNAKTNICAITELHTPNGIGLDKIELYSEPVVKELSLLEQAKLKYPIGTKVTNYNLRLNCKFTIDSKNFEYYNKTEIIVRTVSGNGVYTVYKNGKWAEIVEDFKLPETWKLKVCDKSLNTLISWRKSLNLLYLINIKDIEDYQYITEQGYGVGYKSAPLQSIRPEITFEQFEQYVLHNRFKVGDRFSKQKTISDYFSKSDVYEVTEKEIINLQYVNNQSVAFYKIVETGNTDHGCRILTKNIIR